MSYSHSCGIHFNDRTGPTHENTSVRGISPLAMTYWPVLMCQNMSGSASLITRCVYASTEAIRNRHATTITAKARRLRIESL